MASRASRRAERDGYGEARRSFQFNLATIERHHLVDVRHANLIDHRAIGSPNIDDFSPLLVIDACTHCGASMTVKSGKSSIVLRKIFSSSKPTARSTTGRVSFANGFETSFT